MQCVSELMRYRSQCWFVVCKQSGVKSQWNRAYAFMWLKTADDMTRLFCLSLFMIQNLLFGDYRVQRIFLFCFFKNFTYFFDTERAEVGEAADRGRGRSRLRAWLDSRTTGSCMTGAGESQVALDYKVEHTFWHPSSISRIGQGSQRMWMKGIENESWQY